jgi:NAD(P) transhydrogenase subunit alpha
VPKETAAGEARVALVPEVVAKLVGQGLEVVVEKGAGVAAAFTDEAYKKAGAKLADAKEAFGSDVVAKVAKPSAAEIKLLK